VHIIRRNRKNFLIRDGRIKNHASLDRSPQWRNNQHALRNIKDHPAQCASLSGRVEAKPPGTPDLPLAGILTPYISALYAVGKLF
jgi:hypothetical protein